jgi:hypothetical protein
LGVGHRLCEPFNGYLDGDWLIVEGSNSKTGIPRRIHLNSRQTQVVRELKKRMSENTSSPKTFTTRYSRVFKKACNAIGRKDLHSHNLEDTFAMMRYLETRDIFQVSQKLGHTSIKVTEKYTRFSLRKLEQDFPSLAYGYNDQYITKTMIRNTISRDTIRKKYKSIRGKIFKLALHSKYGGRLAFLGSNPFLSSDLYLDKMSQKITR